MKLIDMTEPELRSLLNAMGQSIEATAREHGAEKPQFVLLLFNDPKVSQYVCNCERAGVIEAMRECAGRLERNEDVPRGRGIMADVTITLDEGERQAVILALAHLSVERPGWDYMLNQIARKMDNHGPDELDRAEMYDSFRAITYKAANSQPPHG